MEITIDVFVTNKVYVLPLCMWNRTLERHGYCFDVTLTSSRFNVIYRLGCIWGQT